MQNPVPTSEHLWLQRLVGEWTFEHECVMGPDQPAVKTAGKQSVRSVGGLWVLGEFSGEMPGGGAAQSFITLGFDPTQQAIVGTFVASCMTFLWLYRGTLDLPTNRLVLDAEGPGFTPDAPMAKYQDIIEILSDSEYTMTSQYQAEDGRWHVFMRGTHRRVTPCG